MSWRWFGWFRPKPVGFFEKFRWVGLAYGDLLSYSYLGEGQVHCRYNKKWMAVGEYGKYFEELEAEYVAMGYKKIELEDWVKAGGYDESHLDDLWKVHDIPMPPVKKPRGWPEPSDNYPPEPVKNPRPRP